MSENCLLFISNLGEISAFSLPELKCQVMSIQNVWKGMRTDFHFRWKFLPLEVTTILAFHLLSFQILEKVTENLFIFYKAEVSLSAVRSLHVELFWAAGAQCLRSGRLQLHDGPDPPEDAGEGHGQPDVQGAGGGRATGEQQHSQTVNTSELRTLITLKLLDINNHAKFYNF